MSRRYYDPEFKREAVRMVLDGDRTLRSVEEALGITRGVLKDWVRLARQEAQASGTKSGNQKDVSVREKALEKELARVKRERDILKKAVAIFSKETNPFSDS